MIRAIELQDWPAIDLVQRACFPASAIESVEALRSIAEAAPELCAVAEELGNVCGYLLAHPWTAEDLPFLNEPITALPPCAGCLFVHDMAILSSARGSGLASQMVRRMLATATEEGMTDASLLSVQETSAFWTRFGFVQRPELTARFRDRVLGFYEIEFHFMTAKLG